MTVETWKTVPFAPEYEASTEGRIRRVGRSNRFGPGHILNPSPNGHGYPSVTLCTGGRRLSVTVHRAVAEAHLGSRPEGHDIAHGDGDQTNSAAANLRWATRKENILDKRLHGTMAEGSRHGSRTKPLALPRGEAHHATRLTTADVIDIRSGRETQVKAAARYGISQSNVSDIRRRNIWRHVPEGASPP